MKMDLLLHITFNRQCAMCAGYKMCARLYLNGDGMGKGTHVSLFFVIMRGPCDALLKWPFRQKVCVRDVALVVGLFVDYFEFLIQPPSD